MSYKVILWWVLVAIFMVATWIITIDDWGVVGGIVFVAFFLTCIKAAHVHVNSPGM